MTLLKLPSLDVPESEKREYTEAEVHSKLFEPDMVALGFPPRTNTQADGEWFQEQRTLAMRRLKSKRDPWSPRRPLPDRQLAGRPLRAKTTRRPGHAGGPSKRRRGS